MRGLLICYDSIYIKMTRIYNHTYNLSQHNHTFIRLSNIISNNIKYLWFNMIGQVIRVINLNLKWWCNGMSTGRSSKSSLLPVHSSPQTTSPYNKSTTKSSHLKLPPSSSLIWSINYPPPPSELKYSRRTSYNYSTLSLRSTRWSWIRLKSTIISPSFKILPGSEITKPSLALAKKR